MFFSLKKYDLIKKFLSTKNKIIPQDVTINYEDEGLNIINGSNEVKYIAIAKIFVFFKQNKYIHLSNKADLIKGEGGGCL